MPFLSRLRKKVRSIIFLEKNPESGEVVLKQRRVFTLPSKPGLLYVSLLLISYLTATNYNLNLGFAMTYLLTGIAVVNALFTFRNLAYLRLSPGPVTPVFAGEQVEFAIQLNNTQNLDRYALHVGFIGKNQIQKTVDVERLNRLTVKLSYPSTQRGSLPIPRIRLQTWFPLGLLRAWSTWLPDTCAIIYPSPELNPPPLPFIGEDDKEGNGNIGTEDFSGVRMYQQGDPLKHLSWKHIARIDTEFGGHLVTKQFSGGALGELWINFAALPPSLDLELRLSRMTSWIIEADRHAFPFAFSIGDIHFPTASSPAHSAACLHALAMFGQPNSLAR